jgi:hypothetical protein
MVDKIHSLPGEKVGPAFGRLAPNDFGKVDRALACFSVSREEPEMRYDPAFRREPRNGGVR